MVTFSYLGKGKLIEGTVNLTFYLFVGIPEIRNQAIEFLKDRMYLNFSSE